MNISFFLFIGSVDSIKDVYSKISSNYSLVLKNMVFRTFAINIFEYNNLLIKLNGFYTLFVIIIPFLRLNINTFSENNKDIN